MESTEVYVKEVRCFCISGGRFRMWVVGSGSVGYDVSGSVYHPQWYECNPLHEKSFEKNPTFPTPFLENSFVCYAFRVKDRV